MYLVYLLQFLVYLISQHFINQLIAFMDHDFFKKLQAEGLISDESFNKIEHRRLHSLFSVHWEIKTLLYIGILLLTTGLGILVYKNIDTIGHQVILIFIALITIGCFVYCFKHKKPFNRGRILVPNPFFDYILLLGTISFMIFIGYLQYAYAVFGNHYGMVTFIPMLVLFYIAYEFDHIGILNIAIANLALWMGISVTPKQLLASGTFNNDIVIYTYLAFSFLLLSAAWVTQKFIFKEHFKFSYQHYGVHVCFIALLAGYFFNYNSSFFMIWMLGLLVLAVLVFRDAFKHKSFYFLLLTILYSYFAISCLVVRTLMALPDSGIFLILFYFIGSAFVLIYCLIYLNKKLKEV